MNGPLFNALLLSDGRLPTGAYSDSAGLEPAVIGGLKLHEVYSYMVARLQTVTRMEAAASVLAHRLATAEAPVSQYTKLETAVDARTPSEAQRKASRSMGRAFLYLAKSLKPDHTAISILDDLASPPTRGVALGAVASALQVSEIHCAQICCYDDMQRIAEATLKVLPTDPAVVTRWLIDVGKNVPEIVEAACNVQEFYELPAISAPWMEQWAEEHSQRTKRLFMA